MSYIIPSTHTGSLPRTDRLVSLMFAEADGIPVDRNALASEIDLAIDSVVRRQVDAKISVINDGEMSKPSYATYVQDRLSGFEGESVQNYFFEDLQDFPRSAEAVAGNPGRRKRKAPSCTSEIKVSNEQAAKNDMTALRAAADRYGHEAIFTSAASPGVISLFFVNDFYRSHEEYVFAIAEAMRHEYEAIAKAGAIVQLDCPDLAMGRHSAYASMDLDSFRKTIAINVEALNYAVRNIPESQLRMHLCWGNYPGPHHHDVPVGEILDIVWAAKPQTVLVEGANSRHAHEWVAFKELGVPADKYLCPGMIEPQSNYIEHPELVAQRLERWAEVVPVERLMAGVDCGFSVHVGSTSIDPDVAFAKLRALSEGCEIAGKKLTS